MAEMEEEDALYWTLVYHTSEAYVSKKGHKPDTMTYLEAWTRKDTWKYWNAMDEDIGQFAERETWSVVPRS